MRPWLAAWLPVTLWAGVIFGFSSIPGTKLPPVDLPMADKLAHLAVYAVLGALVLRGLRRPRSRLAPSPPPPAAGWSWLDLAITVALCTLYGISDEIHQRWTPNRSPDWHDVVADALGSTLGATLGARLGGLAIVAARWMKIRVCLMMGRSKL